MTNQKARDGDDDGPNARVGVVIKGKWRIDSLLGVGGMAAVYAASHRNGQRAALKILHPDFARDKTICERFLREAYVSNKVNHGATVQVLDDDVTEHGEPFLIMELLEGMTVRDAWKMSGSALPSGRVLQICERVLDCLASCHAIKVIHRDLKPANIFILNDGEIRVLDFGVAQMRDASSERTATGTALGTPAYMSPEQAMGLVDQLDGRADLFSVGAMMYALITGHRINGGRTEQEALVMAATRPAPSVARLAPHLPASLIKVIDKSLAWDRRNRFQDAREMQKALLDLMPSQGVGPLAGRPPPRPHEVVAPPVPTSGAAASGSMPAVSPPATLGHPPEPPSFDPLLGGFAGPPLASAAPSSGMAMVEVHESDPRVQAVRDLMKHCDRLFPSVRQLGWTHPATERTLRLVYDAFVEALKEPPGVVFWTLRPYSFMTLGHTVWEPVAPFDAVPYNLFASGIRELRVESGITFEELRELFALCLLDPGRDLPPEDDLVAALWEKALPHVKWECVDAFAEGDASSREAFFGEADELEHLAQVATKDQISRLEVQAMALSTDDAALGKQKERSPFALDEASRQRVASYFDSSHEAWAERFVDALVEGYLDSAAHRDVPLVLASLRRSSADLIVAGRLMVAIQIFVAIIERLRARVEGAENQAKLAAALTNAMFGGEALEILLAHLRDDPSGVESFGMVLPGLAGSEFSTVLASLREVTDPALQKLLASYPERWVSGRESELAGAAPGSQPEIGAYIVQLLGRMGTPSARQALGQLAQQSEDMNVCVEARVILVPSAEHAQKELSALLDNPSAVVRMAALRTSTRYGMRQVWPVIGRIIGAKNFNDLGIDERREWLRACVDLSPEHGESMVLDLARKGGMLTSEEREVTRATAAELLGELSRSRATATALSEIASARWGVSEETRMAAANAAKRIGLRLAGQHGSAAS